MINTCKICGKKFTARQSNYIICSPECRKVNMQQHSKNYYDEPAKVHIYNKRYYQKHRSLKLRSCLLCGSILPDARQKYCIDCILNMFLYGNRTKAVHILSCRGYDVPMIQDLIEEKGI